MRLKKLTFARNLMKRSTRRTVLKLTAIAGVFKRRELRQLFLIAICSVVIGLAVIYALPGEAQTSSSFCSRPPAGSVVTNPPEIQNSKASTPVNFTVLNIAPGQNCYLADGNLEAPTLRVTPSKKDLVLRLTNRLSGQSLPVSQQTLCVGGMAPPNSTSLHYHGLNISPTCHQDEVVKTVIKPNETFEFKLQIPKKEPPGLYWYHPHIHMQSEEQVLSGLTGAIIVEGIKKYNKQAAKLPERVFVLRDMKLLQEFPESDTEQPGKDISINSVPIRYQGGGKYDPPAVIQMQPNQSQFWRVANTAADSYFDLQVTYDNTPQQLELVAMDGVPINVDGPKDKTLPVNHILLPPAGRAEFIINGPGSAVKDAKFLTLKYDTKGDGNPQRTIARIDTQAQFTAAALSTSAAESNVDENQVSGDRFSGLSQENSIQQRTLFFSQTPPGAPKEEFYITVKGNQPKVYDPNFKTPDITVQEGTTEDWIVENHAPEAHAFHIHQIHFLVLQSPNSSEIGMLRDTINLPAWDGGNTPYPSVKLRMDFRGVKKDTSIAGTFVYHCHILEHEDGGMMAPIEVKSS